MNQHDSSWFQQHLLRGLFVVALCWLTVVAPLLLFGDALFEIVTEGSFFHDILENWFMPIALLVGLVVSFLLFWVWSQLLKVPPETSLRFQLTRLLLYGVIVYVVLTVVVAVGSMIIDPPWRESDNLQHIPLVFYATLFYPPVLAPIVTVLVFWRMALRKTRVAS